MRRVVVGPSLRTARIRRMPTARRPWLVTVRSDGTVAPWWPRTHHTFEEARTAALTAVGLDRPAEHREAP